MHSCALCTLGKTHSGKVKGVTLSLKKSGAIPVEVAGILPELVFGKEPVEIASFKVLVGNESVDLGDVFEVKYEGDEALIFEGELKHVKGIGVEMTSGLIMVNGDAGMHLGQRMKGGTIVVNGNLEPRWGGMIMVFGSVGNRVGEGMRRGLIAVTGDAGDFAGVNMIAGTIVVFGKMGLNSGGGMKRGSIVSIGGTDRVLSTFGYSCL
ncbi:MAG: Formylmethanofuran dehydrogenase subunit C, partial [Thermoanaerobacterales bacterium 50_218]